MPGSTITPRRVVLNLVRVTPERAIAVQRLVEAGALFGFKGNAVRVAVTRLVSDGLLQSDERGSYRLGSAAQAKNRHVEQWRSGEARVRPWSGGWLAVVLPSSLERAARRSSLQALSQLGFCEGWPGLWVRPDNLSACIDGLSERLLSLGLSEQAELFGLERPSARLAAHFATELWPLSALQRGYERSIAALRESLDRLDSMPREQALVQSFLLGGEAIAVLAKDPLLPAELMDVSGRAELSELMLRYDRVGHRLWRSFATGRGSRGLELVAQPGDKHAS
ncbi:MAG: hypothetical protein OEZ06_28225 [Myxococcales bacterium]|nr:hypothetical protein [Myxococcales bacterium]